MKKENKKTILPGKAEREALAGKPAPAASGKGEKKDLPAASGTGGFPSIKLAERERQAGFALLAAAAVALAAYVVFFMPPPDAPSDMDTFVGRVLGAGNVSIFMDARGTAQEQSRLVFQCGVDIAGGRLFGPKTITTYACDDNGCISANSASNGSSILTYDTVQKKLGGTPYIIVRAGAPSTKFFQNHAEITIDESFNQSCRLG
ncbi:MAG: hypothetical protein NTX79_00465 [Candidatus Micrarchaeota archaeon]|nr:hypothetical protein [Candidatus Micrarchaeota archaeon]